MVVIVVAKTMRENQRLGKREESRRVYMHPARRFANGMEWVVGGYSGHPQGVIGAGI